ncbi:acetyltransferase (GNAT) family protein [Chitinophaga dinghuensis]|uniref:Acetyltransferase (GNAT) family protein n=1 Tax=Chitinophaga dinghuensis TaxID=1539050 RepID=A0A327W8R5_9BACT|nr:GNAT family N-acetyltransferase [Chitinophaga dinghuensis]RAJ85632.1 acetyltransferase (GNAT) family protein [Chitinophaga dinghuensis]
MDISEFREGQLQDASAVAALLLRSYEQYRQDLDAEHWRTLSGKIGDEAYIRDLMGYSCMLVFEENKTIHGVVFLVPSGNPTDIYPASWSYIRLLGVDPLVRGRGIGLRLMEMAIEKAREGGEEVLGLHTSTIMLAARRMYEQIGFQVVKELEPLLGVEYWLYRMNL